VDFAKPPARKKIRLSRRFSDCLFYRRSLKADKFNVSPIEKTKYCTKVIPGMTQITLRYQIQIGSY